MPNQLALVLPITLAVALAGGLVGGGLKWNHHEEAPREADLSLEEARAMILAPMGGSERLDEQIRGLQHRVSHARVPEPHLEQLGTLFIAKARKSCDPGFYKLAEQSARLLEAHSPDPAPALLLRGHSLLAIHRFAEGEALARQLVGLRENMLDYALLGDALMEQGKLGEAKDAYQQMVDLRPCLPAYSRVAHLRWLKGDLDGAIDMIQLAISTGSYRDPEPLAWTTTRLASYEFERSAFRPALQISARALEIEPDYPPALLLRGRIFLAQSQPALAAEMLHAAVARNPLPEYQWVLVEAARAAGLEAAAQKVEIQLAQTGAARDPRTYALYLATHGKSPREALQLAEEELRGRADIFTHDALAWALLANGRSTEAWEHSQRALGEGTQDARLFLHGGVIAQAVGDTAEAARLLGLARARRLTLLPSEIAELDRAQVALTEVFTSL